MTMDDDGRRWTTMDDDGRRWTTMDGIGQIAWLDVTEAAPRVSYLENREAELEQMMRLTLRNWLRTQHNGSNSWDQLFGILQGLSSCWLRHYCTISRYSKGRCLSIVSLVGQPARLRITSVFLIIIIINTPSKQAFFSFEYAHFVTMTIASYSGTTIFVSLSLTHTFS